MIVSGEIVMEKNQAKGTLANMRQDVFSFYEK